MSEYVQRRMELLASRQTITLEDLRGRSRRARIVAARHEAMAAQHRDGATLSQIARFFCRHHTTVLHAVRKMAEAQR